MTMDLILYCVLIIAQMIECGIIIYALIAQTNEMKETLEYWANRFLNNNTKN